MSSREVHALLLAAFCLVAGCDALKGGGDAPERDAPGHEAEEKSDSLTVWGERHEIFIEHPLLVRGRPNKFVTHVTDLQTFQARAKGEITLILESSGRREEVVAKAPVRDGLYTPELTFPTSGEWTVTVKIPESDRTYEVRLPTRWVFDTEAEVARVSAPAGPEGITFLKEQQWRMPFATAEVAQEGVRERLTLSGWVSACADAKAQVTAPLAGRLEASGKEGLPSIGDRVERGQVLALVRPPITSSELLALAQTRQGELSLQQEIESLVFQRRTLEAELRGKLAEAKAGEIKASTALKIAQETHERVQRLRASNSRTDIDVEVARQGVDQAKAELDSVQALVSAYERSIANLDSLLSAPATRPSDEEEERFPVFEVPAPIAGIVVAQDAIVGQFVRPEEPLFAILDSSRVLLEARVPESEMGRIGTSRDALYERPDALDRFVPVLGEGGGRFVYLGLEVDPETRTVPLVYEVPNPDGTLRPGMALSLEVETGRVEDAKVVPASALVDEGGQVVAFVQVSGETFAKRTVTIGLSEGDRVQVLSGLAAGERVVTKGAYALRLASVATSIPAHGHGH